MADWTETHRPTTKQEVRGNDKARDKLWKWARTWDDHREPALLYGSPGVGKTSAAHALASDMGWEVVELNASDERTADRIERLAGRASRNTTLAGAADESKKGDADRGRQLVVLDEADNIHYHHDSGGQRAVTDMLKEAGQPVVLVANDRYGMSRGMRSACREIEFRDVSARSIEPVLRDICREEGVEFESEAIERIAETNDGDLRGAIKDLQAAAQGRDAITAEDVATGSRDRTQDIFSLLDAVLKEQSAEDALETAYATDETPDDLLLWVEDKVPKVYEGEELADAYGYLANADRWLGRVRATQNYTYWRYATDNLAAGVAAAREHDRGGWTRYGGAPYRSSSDATRDHVARRIATVEHTSIGTARRELLPFLAAMTHHCRNRELTVEMAARYDLDADHVAFVTGSGADTNKVEEIVADARERQEQEAVEHGGDAFAPATGEESDAADSEAADDGGDDGASGTLADFGGDGADTDDGEPEDSADEGVDEEADDEHAKEEQAAADDQQSGLGDFT